MVSRRRGDWERLPGLFRFGEFAALMDHGGGTGSDCVSRASYAGLDKTGEPLYRVYVSVAPEADLRIPVVRTSGVVQPNERSQRIRRA
jgi:hypothetical protein